MLLHLARISVITIALALVGGVGYLLSRPSSPTVITVVVPNAPAVAAAAPAAPAVQTVQHVYHPYWWSSYAHPYYGTHYVACGRGLCWQ